MGIGPSAAADGFDHAYQGRAELHRLRSAPMGFWAARIDVPQAGACSRTRSISAGQQARADVLDNFFAMDPGSSGAASRTPETLFDQLMKVGQQGKE